MEKHLQIERLTEKFKLGKLTDKELSLLLNYLKDKEPTNEILVYYQNIWDKTEEYKNDINSKSLYNQIIRTIGITNRESISSNESQKEILFTGYIKTLMRYAAVFILGIGLSSLVYSYFWNGAKNTLIVDQVQKIEVPFGSKSRVILPDGSVVTLNSGSSLKYSALDFNSGNRSVFLTGEGFFNVTKDPARPFYATTPGIKVKVLGTTFNLKAYPDENIEEATVVTGEVEIYVSSDKTEKGKSIILKPNQKAVFVKSDNEFRTNNTTNVNPVIKPVTLRTVNLQPSSKIEQTVSWKEDKLIFDNEPFSNLVIKIERWYNVEIDVKYQELNSARFTGRFDKETLEQVLNALVTVTPFKYIIKQNIITITKN